MQVDDEKVSVENPKQNTASRLFALLRQLPSTMAGKRPPPGWVLAAGGELSSIESEVDHDATRIVKAVGTALEDLGRELAAVGVPPHLVVQPLTRLAPLSEPRFLHGTNDNTLNKLDGETMLSLQWMAFVLPGDRLFADDADIQQLKALLNELREALMQPGVPFALRAFGHEQVQVLSDALLLYSIKGVAPLQRAARSAITEIQAHEEVLDKQFKSATDKAPVATVFRKLAGAVKGVLKVAGEAEKAIKTGEFLSGKFSQAVQLLEDLSNKP